MQKLFPLFAHIENNLMKTCDFFIKDKSICFSEQFLISKIRRKRTFSYSFEITANEAENEEKLLYR